MFLSLLLTTLVWADSLVVLSQQSEAPSVLPKLFVAEFGAFIEAQDGAAMRSITINSLECRRDPAGKSRCSFSLPGEAEARKVESTELLRGLKGLSEAGLSTGQCAEGGDCELKVASIHCMVNESLGEDAPGKYGCAFFGI